MGRTVEHGKVPAARGELVKVTVPLENPAWHGYGAELLWAELSTPGIYRLRNSPFYAHGLSAYDMVAAEYQDEKLAFRAVRERGGHSTYRLHVPAGIDTPAFQLAWRPLQTIGCTYEQADRLLAVDVPPATDIYEAYELFEAGVKAGVWDFDEGHCGHPLRATRGSKTDE
ncbi:MAG TPA: DUF4265 domain-containing protein [Gemmatimonadales bacterium]|nr:DUF4265 domain-containing protein [Gemmatimonadales bacterium]